MSWGLMSWVVACRVTYQLGGKHLATSSCVPPSTIPVGDLPLPFTYLGKISEPAGENIDTILVFQRLLLYVVNESIPYKAGVKK